MGNKCSVKKNTEDDNLTDYDRTIYYQKKEKVFYGTIAICVLYASFALLLLLASYLSDKIKYLLLNNFLPFTIVYVIGTIFIVFYLINQVLNFKPYKIDKNARYDSLSCPDYWILEKVISSDNSSNNLFKNMFDSNVVNYNLFNYRCKLNNNVFDKYDIYSSDNNYNFTNLNNTDNKPSTTDKNIILNNPDNYNIYTNVLNSSNLNNINKNIFKNNSNLNLKYELIKNNLIMNNYKIIEEPEKGDYSIFERTYKNDSKDIYNNFSINYQNYNINDGSRIDDKFIKVIKSSGQVQISDTINGTYTSINELPMVCDNVYPMFLANRDELINSKDNEYDNNVFRCAYSKMCKVPWSDMNCDKYN